MIVYNYANEYVNVYVYSICEHPQENVARVPDADLCEILTQGTKMVNLN